MSVLENELAALQKRHDGLVKEIDVMRGEFLARKRNGARTADVAFLKQDIAAKDLERQQIGREMRKVRHLIGSESGHGLRLKLTSLANLWSFAVCLVADLDNLFLVVGPPFSQSAVVL